MNFNKHEILYVFEKRDGKRLIYEKFKDMVIGAELDEYLHSPTKSAIVDTLCSFMMHQFLDLILSELLESIDVLTREPRMEKMNHD